MQMTDSGRTCTVILPTYNEEKNIAGMVTLLREMYPDFRILIMDDGSADRSKELVDALGYDNVVFFVRDPDDRGLTASVCQGITETNTDYFICMDSDFQHPLSSVGQIYGSLEDGYDLCIGVRRSRKVLGLKRSLGSWIFQIMASAVLFFRGKKRSADIMSGFFGGRTEVFSEVIRDHGGRFEMPGFKVLFDLMKYSPDGINIGEVSYEFGERREGESKINPKVVKSALRQMGVIGRFLARIYGAVKK
ncbi:MAG: glycosyltransferase [Candidatus Methanoplasma sp.]|jgi:dolichol-phosphate mannosyltransferase|nr:glycosyltransferase [Candidatus Methanoplasma sp.]